MSVLAKRVIERPAHLFLAALRNKSANPEFVTPPVATSSTAPTAPSPTVENSEDVVRFKSPYITFNKSDPLCLDSLLNEEEKMIRFI